MKLDFIKFKLISREIKLIMIRYYFVLRLDISNRREEDNYNIGRII